MNQPKSSPQLSLLLDGPISYMLWKLAGPNVLGVVMTILVTFCDAWFVADLGTVALASLALVFPFQTLIVFMAAGAIGGGVTSAISRALGRGTLSEVSALAWHAVVIGISMSSLFILTLGLFPQEIFQGMGGTGEVLTGAVSYAQIAFGGSIVTWMLYILAAVFRGSGDTLTPARIFVIGSSCQIFFSGAFTLGWGPFPEMGVIGPAIALIICHAGMALFLASHLYLGKGLLQLKPSPLRLVFFIDIMRVGGIGLINNVTVAFSVVVVTAILGHFGAAALAGYGLGSRLELMLTPLVFGVGSALTAGVGANVGAQNFQRARSIAWAGASIAFLVTGGIGIMVAVIPELWLDWFTADEAAYEVAVLYLAIAGPFYGFFGAGQALYFASQGTGRLLLPICVGVVRFLTISLVGLVAVLVDWPIQVVFAGVSAGLLVTGIGMALCLFSPDWRPRLQTSKN